MDQLKNVPDRLEREKFAALRLSPARVSNRQAREMCDSESDKTNVEFIIITFSPLSLLERALKQIESLREDENRKKTETRRSLWQ